MSVGRPMVSSLAFATFLPDSVPAKEKLLSLAEQESAIVQEMSRLREEMAKIRASATEEMGDLTPNQVKAAKAAFKAANPDAEKTQE